LRQTARWLLVFIFFFFNLTVRLSHSLSAPLNTLDKEVTDNFQAKAFDIFDIFSFLFCFASNPFGLY